MINVRLKN